MTMMEKPFIDIGAIADIPVRGARVVKTPRACIAVFRTAEDTAFALEDRCPHLGGPLSRGALRGRTLVCPWHAWMIDVPTGQVRGGRGAAVRTCPARVRDGFVEVGALAGMGA